MIKNFRLFPLLVLSVSSFAHAAERDLTQIKEFCSSTFEDDSRYTQCFWQSLAAARGQSVDVLMKDKDLVRQAQSRNVIEDPQLDLRSVSRPGRKTDEQIIQLCESSDDPEGAVDCFQNELIARNLEDLEALSGRVASNTSRIEALEAHGVEVDVRLAALEADARTGGVQQPARTQAPTRQSSAPQVTYQSRTSGMSVFNLESTFANTLHITDVDQRDSKEMCGTPAARYLVVLNHGQPMAGLAPGGQHLNLTPVFYDQNGDGRVDKGPDLDGDGDQDPLFMYVVDTRVHDDIWITWEPGDDVVVRYLVETRTRPVINGQAYPMVRDVKQGEATRGANGCKRSQYSIPGGHQALDLESWTRVYY